MLLLQSAPVKNTRLIDLRLKRGLTQQQLAKLTGVTAQYISLLERGERPVTERVGRKLMGPLKCSLAATGASRRSRTPIQ